MTDSVTDTAAGLPDACPMCPSADEFTSGTCSVCGGRAERGKSGAWWHVDQSCFVPGYLPPPALFVEGESNGR